ncbi:hypothetical protein BDY21DRAFT_424701 [Lineolata rhizophorae]|uniref:Uncharacterized protein n=1 Tax=Lineolata rhizophorae TaxID=578093 RepID=A0A6A6NMX9_9PEZI|nr:hypothetical protein BDY21DRAFT_424701 [Lineolata rhizophorae]
MTAFSAGLRVTIFVTAHTMLDSSSLLMTAPPGYFAPRESAGSTMDMRTRRSPWRLLSSILSAMKPQHRLRKSDPGASRHKAVSGGVSVNDFLKDVKGGTRLLSDDPHIDSPDSPTPELRLPTPPPTRKAHDILQAGGVNTKK